MRASVGNTPYTLCEAPGPFADCNGALLGRGHGAGFQRANVGADSLVRETPLPEEPSCYSAGQHSAFGSHIMPGHTDSGRLIEHPLKDTYSQEVDDLGVRTGRHPLQEFKYSPQHIEVPVGIQQIPQDRVQHKFDDQVLTSALDILEQPGLLLKRGP